MGRSAVFVDAGYFWVQACQSVLGRPGQRSEISIDYQTLRDRLLDEVSRTTQQSELLRVYWYDGPVSGGKGPDHLRIDELDDFKLRLGTRNHAGQQKAVDGLIIADMLNLTQSRAIDHAVLISGDADLTPGVTAAQAMGLRVHLVVLEPRWPATSPYLAAEADRKLYLDSVWIASFAMASIAPPQAANTTPTATPAQSSPIAIPVRSTASLDFDAIALKAHQDMRASSISQSVAALGKSTIMLPPDVDKRLLFEGKSHVGRDLSEQEKRMLRSAFKKLL